MKLFKPSYSYGAKQSNFSKYEHHEQMSQSNYALDAKPCYDAQAQDYFLGQPMGGFDANKSHQARDQNFINYHAHAQSAPPSLPLHVQQDHQVGKMNRHESHMGNEWADNSPEYAYPAQIDDLALGMHDEKHMMGGMDHGWGTKPNQYSSPTQTNQFNESDHKGYGQKVYNHVNDGIKGGWGNNPNGYSNPNQTHDFGESGYKGHEQNGYNYTEGQIEGGYANKNNAFSSPKYLSPIKTTQPYITKHKEGRGWPNSTSNYSSPTHAQRSNLGMHKDSHMMGKLDNYWANSPTKYPSSAPAHQSSDHGWDNSPSKLYSPSHAHYSSRGIHRDEHMSGNENRGWATSPMKYSAPNDFNKSNERGHTQLGWGQNTSRGLGLNQANNSSYPVNDEEYDQYVDDDVHEIMDEILTKYPAHNVGSGTEKSLCGKPDSYAGQNKFAGYAKQAIGGLARYGGAVQSMSNSSAKFALTKENNNAGYSSNFGKEEHSASSNNSKYEAKFTLDRGRYR